MLLEKYVCVSCRTYMIHKHILTYIVGVTVYFWCILYFIWQMLKTIIFVSSICTLDIILGIYERKSKTIKIIIRALNVCIWKYYIIGYYYIYLKYVIYEKCIVIIAKLLLFFYHWLLVFKVNATTIKCID